MSSSIHNRWTIAAAMHVVMALSGMVLFAKGVFFPSLVAEFQFSHTQTSLLFSINSIAGCVTALGVGWFLLRGVDARIVLLVPMIILGLANIVAATAHSYTQLIVAYILMGSFNVCAVAIPVLVSNWFSERRGVALGIGLSGSTTSGVLLAPLLGLVVQSWGWRAGFYTVAALLLVLLPPLILGLIRTRPEQALEKSHTSDAELPGMTLLEAARTRTFWLILIAYATYMAHTGGYLVHFIPSLTDKGFSLSHASTVMGALYLLAAVSKFSFGYFADRGRPNLLATISLLFAAIGLVSFAQIAGWPGLIIFTLFYGLTYSVPMVLFPLIVQDRFGRRQFAAIDATMVVSSIAIGGWTGPLLIGSVYDLTHSYPTAFFVLSAMPALGAIAILFAGRGIKGRPFVTTEAGA